MSGMASGALHALWSLGTDADIPQRGAPNEAERRLACAVIEAAWRDLDSPLDIQRADARAWIVDHIQHPYSFEWLCAALQLDAEYLRECLLGRS